MEAEQASWRQRLFQILASAELVTLVLLLSNAPSGGPIGGAAAFILLVGAVVLGGFVATVIAWFDRPRPASVILSMVAHGLVIGVVGAACLVNAIAESEWLRRLKNEMAASDERAQAQTRAHQKALAHSLTELVRGKRYAEARAFLRNHDELELGSGSPLSDALCPADKSAPDFELVTLMGEHGAPKNGDLLLEAEKCSLQTFTAVIRRGTPASSPTRAGVPAFMELRSTEALQYLFQHGLDANARAADGSTALMHHRSPEITRLLLAHGADPKAVDNEGRSALHYGGPPDQLGGIYELLLQLGADPNLKDKTPRELGPLAAMALCDVRKWSESAAQVLVKYGASAHDQQVAVRQILDEEPISSYLQWPGLDLGGQGGANLLVSALRRRRLDVVEELLAAGANPTIESDDRDTALGYYRDVWGATSPKTETYRALLDAEQRFQRHDGGR